jgi:hypothetical protein
VHNQHHRCRTEQQLLADATVFPAPAVGLIANEVGNISFASEVILQRHLHTADRDLDLHAQVHERFASAANFPALANQAGAKCPLEHAQRVATRSPSATRPRATTHRITSLLSRIEAGKVA